jgi:hypothetical protein
MLSPLCKAQKALRMFQVFLGFANYYRHNIWNFAMLTHLLTLLLPKSVPFCWEQHAQASFNVLKHTFSSALLLHHYNS